jgi:hypothetical protein
MRVEPRKVVSGTDGKTAKRIVLIMATHFSKIAFMGEEFSMNTEVNIHLRARAQDKDFIERAAEIEAEFLK